MQTTIGHDSFTVRVDAFKLDADPAKILESDIGLCFVTGCMRMTTYATSAKLREFAHALVVACDQFDASKRKGEEE